MVTWSKNIMMHSCFVEFVLANRILTCITSTHQRMLEGEASWVLHVHIICLNYDGNAFDLCLLAAIAALED